MTMDGQINTKYQTAAMLAEAASMKKGWISRVNQDGLYSQMNILIVERWNTETSEKYCMFISMKRTALYAGGYFSGVCTIRAACFLPWTPPFSWSAGVFS